MIPPEALAAGTGAAVFLGFPLARWAADRLVERADRAWQDSSLEWLQSQGAAGPKSVVSPTYPPTREGPLRVGFSIIGALMGFSAGTPIVAALFVLICLIASSAALADLRAQILPDLLVGVLGILGIILSVFEAGPAPREALIGLAAGGTIFWVISRSYAAFRGREGLGLGDVKLFAVAGLFVGWAKLPFVALVAVCLMICVLVGTWSLRQSKDARLPFGPSIAAACLLCFAVSPLL